jgi:hypothetical protein
MLTEERTQNVFEIRLLTGYLGLGDPNLGAIGENFTVRSFMNCATPDIAIKSRNV